MSFWSDEVLTSWMKGAPEASLLEEWLSWNISPLQHASKATLSSLFPISLQPLFLSDDRVKAYINRKLRARLLWSSTVTWTPEDRLWEIAMIAPERFEKLALLGASFSMKSEIAKLIDGTTVRKLRSRLGDDAFQFVLLGAGGEKYFLESLHHAFLNSSDITEAIVEGARILVEQAFSSKERGTQERIATKFPGCFAQGYQDAPLPWSLKAEEVIYQLWKEVGAWL